MGTFTLRPWYDDGLFSTAVLADGLSLQVPLYCNMEAL